MEEFWPEWELNAARIFTTLPISDATTEGFSDDKNMYSRHEEAVLQKVIQIFLKSTMKEQDKQVSDP